MRNKAYITIATASLFAVATSLRAQSTVVINEVMQSNIDYLMVDNDFPDSWVELYNSSNSNVNLSGYYISEKSDKTKGYMLPSEAVVPAKGHLLIYCDKENHGLHASFRVDAGKASVYLLDPQGNVVDGLTLGEMPAANVAYGRVTDGADAWQYEIEPTAGAANGGGGAESVLPNPVFSLPGGLYSAGDYQLTITLPEGAPEDAMVYYTTDGKEPNAESASAKEVSLSISSTTVVRAKIISASGAGLTSRSFTQSYIFHPRQVTMPVISLVSELDYFYSSNMGILSAAVNDGKPNYMQKWRRPLNVEYYSAEDGKLVFNQLGETAVSGVSTRENAQKSMKIYANKRFGKKNFKGNFWAEKPEVTKVKSFVIRNGGNNSFLGRINDAVVQRLFGNNVENLDWQAYQPVIVYLNGRYLGEFAMRERSDEDFIAANYDGLEDVELADEVSYQEAESGTLFSDFRNSYSRSDVTYEELSQLMDVDNFMKVAIAEIYGQNTDFPTNNVAMWRPTEEGGKWRWIIKDMDRFAVDMMMYPPTFDMFRFLFDPDPLQFSGMHHFDLYKKMISFPEFRERFIDHFSAYLGDFLRGGDVNALIDSMDAEIYDELKATFKAYNVKFAGFTTSTEFMKSVAAERPSILSGQMSDFFGLGSCVPLRVLSSDSTIYFNDVLLTTGTFDGSYFLNRQLRLSSSAAVKSWKVEILFKDGSTSLHTISAPELSLILGEYITDASQVKSVTLQAIVNDEDVDEPTPDEPTPDEPTPDDPTPDEPTPDEPTPDEPTPDDPTPDEPTPDEPTPEDPTPEDPTPEDPTPEVDVAIKSATKSSRPIVIYNLQGVKLGNGYTQNGKIYIINGKKVVK